MRSENRKTLLKYILPSILSVLSTSLFIIIDGIFIGRGVGANGLGAVNIVWPYVVIINSVVLLFTIGGMTITAIKFGENDTEGANKAFLHSFYLVLFFSIPVSILTCVFVTPLCTALGANDVFLPYAADYLFMLAVFMVPACLYSAFCAFVRNDADPFRVSIAVVITSCFNIFGDWFFVFPMNMGITGAAFATGLAEVLGVVITLTHFKNKTHLLHFKKLRPELSVIKTILLRGLPECISQFFSSVTTIVTNLVIMSYPILLGEWAMNVYAIILYIGYIVIAVSLGTAEGLQPLFGQSYGAKKFDDLDYYLKRGMIITISLSAIMLIAICIFGKPLFALFSEDTALVAASFSLSCIYLWAFVPSSVNTLTSAYLYSTTKTKPAVVLNILRCFVIDIIIILVIPALFGAETVWWTLFISESIILIISVFLLLKYRKIISEGG